MRTPSTATGILRFDPKADVAHQPWWAILECDPSWYWYYSQWLNRHGPASWKNVVDRNRVVKSQFVDLKPRLALVRQEFAQPAWGPHISVIRGEPARACREDWGRWEGAVVQFEFDPEPRTDGTHWWLPVECPELLNLRERFGLKRHQLYPLHLTIGVVPSYPKG